MMNTGWKPAARRARARIDRQANRQVIDRCAAFQRAIAAGYFNPAASEAQYRAFEKQEVAR